jgi:hypothetical protein
MTQKIFTFEKVRELKEFLAHKRKEHDTFDVVELFVLIDEWFEQSQLELIDELNGDISDLKKELWHINYNLDVFVKIKDELQDKFDLLKLQQKQFDPNWDFGGYAKKAELVFIYTDASGCQMPIHSDNVVATFERPKPTPQVEVGQVWRNEFGDSEIVDINEKQVVRKCEQGEFSICHIEDFISNFERVS